MMKTTGESGEGLGRRERVTLPPGNVTHLRNIQNNVTSLVFTQNHCAATGPLGFWVLQSFLSTLLRSLQRELGGSMLVRLLAIGNQVGTSEWLEGVTPRPPYWEEMCSMPLLS